MYEALTYGMLVKVRRQRKYRGYKLLDQVGIVRSTYSSGSIPIEFKDLSNPNSLYGYFYFKRDELEIVNEYNMEENNMENVTNYFNAIKIRFIGDGCDCKYVYANFIPELTVGDMVVVMTAHHGLALARVSEILDGNDYEVVREVVDKIELSAYEDRKKIRNQAAELKAKMQERAKQLQDIALYQMLAKDDPAMQELLNEYQALPKI